MVNISCLPLCLRSLSYFFSPSLRLDYSSSACLLGHVGTSGHRVASYTTKQVLEDKIIVIWRCDRRGKHGSVSVPADDGDHGCTASQIPAVPLHCLKCARYSEKSFCGTPSKFSLILRIRNQLPAVSLEARRPLPFQRNRSKVLCTQENT